MSAGDALDDTSQAVLRILAEDGDGTLPSLTREELFTLSDAAVLDHGGDRAWWEALDDAGRALVAQTAQRGLFARNLLVSGEADAVTIDARVRVILRARSEPAWLAVLAEPGAGVQLVASGIDLGERDTRAVLLSARIEGIYLNRLLAPHEAVATLVDWLVRELPSGAGHGGRSVEVLTPCEADRADTVVSSRAIVVGDGAAWALSDVDPASGQPGDPRPADRSVLREWFEERLTLGARAGTGGGR